MEVQTYCEVWTGREAYVSPHEYMDTSYFCSYRVIWVATRKRSTRSRMTPFYYKQLGSDHALKVGLNFWAFKFKSCLAVA